MGEINYVGKIGRVSFSQFNAKNTAISTRTNTAVTHMTQTRPICTDRATKITLLPIFVFAHDDFILCFTL